jgi:hypothetical protein
VSLIGPRGASNCLSCCSFLLTESHVLAHNDGSIGGVLANIVYICCHLRGGGGPFSLQLFYSGVVVQIVGGALTELHLV